MNMVINTVETAHSEVIGITELYITLLIANILLFMSLNLVMGLQDYNVFLFHEQQGIFRNNSISIPVLICWL